MPREGGRGWKRTHSELSTQDQELGEGWRQDMATGAKYVMEETWVKANDPHYDAKLFVAAHPHGTGSVLSEPYAGSPKQHAKTCAP